MFTAAERIADRTLGNPDNGSCAYPGELGSAVARAPSKRIAKLKTSTEPTDSKIPCSTSPNKKARKKLQPKSFLPSEAGGANAVEPAVKPAVKPAVETAVKPGTENRMRASSAPSRKQLAIWAASRKA